jgi:nucleotide-binding universal stress UspA family protein
MFKSILVHLLGTGRDEDVLAAAALAAQPFAAHLDCLYVQPDPTSVVANSEAAFATASLVVESMRAVQQSGEEGASRALERYRQFLSAQAIPVLETPEAVHHVTAAFVRAIGDPVSLLAEAARSHDLTVLAGKGTDRDVLLLEDVGSILVESGRPLLLAPQEYGPRNFRTIAIAWKNKPESARAVGAAMPLLERADTIALLAADEGGPREPFVRNFEAVTAQLRWHGLKIQPRIVVADELPVPQAVLATAHHVSADLLVMGGYGRGRLREFIFGGFTEHVLKGTDLPIFMMH